MEIKRNLKFNGQLPLSEAQREQAKRGMEIMDITKASSVPSALKDNDGTPLSGDYSAAKRFIREIFRPALKEIGIKRNMKNFSKDYPLNTLGDANSDFISRMAARILENEATAQCVWNVFFGLFGEEYDRYLAAYAAQKEKTPDELTDDEHREAAHDFTVQKGSLALSELLLAQKAKEVFEIARKALSEEDFAGKEGIHNGDSVNYHNKFYHRRTKSGGTVSIEGEKVKKEVDAKCTNAPVEDPAALERILKKLDEEEQRIVVLRLEGFKESEIAEKLGYKSQGTISKKMKKMKKKLKDY